MLQCWSSTSISSRQNKSTAWSGNGSSPYPAHYSWSIGIHFCLLLSSIFYPISFGGKTISWVYYISYRTVYVTRYWQISCTKRCVPRCSPVYLLDRKPNLNLQLRYSDQNAINPDGPAWLRQHQCVYASQSPLPWWLLNSFPVFMTLRMHAINNRNWYWTVSLFVIGCLAIPVNLVSHSHYICNYYAQVWSSSFRHWSSWTSLRQTTILLQAVMRQLLSPPMLGTGSSWVVYWYRLWLI